MCCGKGQEPEICGNNVTVLACVDKSRDNDDINDDVSSEDVKAFMCDASGNLSGV